MNNNHNYVSEFPTGKHKLIHVTVSVHPTILSKTFQRGLTPTFSGGVNVIFEKNQTHCKRCLKFRPK